MGSDVLVGVDGKNSPSFSLGNRARRTVWNFVCAIAFRPSPRPFHHWRASLLRLFGAQIGEGVHVYSSVRIWAPWNLRLGPMSSLGDRVNCYSMGLITIGAESVISQDVTLCAGTHDYESPNFQLYVAPIEIGSKVWVCAEAFVGPNSKIGDGAVIGARAVVVKEIPPWTVWGGNPARKIKDRRH
jgi:putative colanic acid biosynthesis acetyltransferase WcaF